MSTAEAQPMTSVYYNQDRKIFECYAQGQYGNYVRTYFVFPPRMVAGDQLPPLYIHAFGQNDIIFKFHGEYEEESDNLAFYLEGPVGYIYKMALQVDPASGGQHQPYSWKIKRHGHCQIGLGNDCTRIYVPRTICLRPASLLEAESDVIKRWTFYGSSVPEQFGRLQLKVQFDVARCGENPDNNFPRMSPGLKAYYPNPDEGGVQNKAMALAAEDSSDESGSEALDLEVCEGEVNPKARPMAFLSATSRETAGGNRVLTSNPMYEEEDALSSTDEEQKKQEVKLSECDPGAVQPSSSSGVDIGAACPTMSPQSGNILSAISEFSAVNSPAPASPSDNDREHCQGPTTTVAAKSWTPPDMVTPLEEGNCSFSSTPSSSMTTTSLRPGCWSIYRTGCVQGDDDSSPPICSNGAGQQGCLNGYAWATKCLDGGPQMRGSWLQECMGMNSASSSQQAFSASSGNTSCSPIDANGSFHQQRTPTRVCTTAKVNCNGPRLSSHQSHAVKETPRIRQTDEARPATAIVECEATKKRREGPRRVTRNYNQSFVFNRINVDYQKKPIAATNKTTAVSRGRLDKRMTCQEEPASH